MGQKKYVTLSLYCVSFFTSYTPFHTASKHLDGKAVLDAIEVQQGILVERAENVYSFSHLTIQEFLTAQYIEDDQQQLDKLIVNHLVNDRWREVFLLVAGLKRSADKLLLTIEKQARTYIKGAKIKACFQEINNGASTMKGAYNHAAKRALFAYYIFDSSAALELARSLDSNLAHELSSSVSPHYDAEHTRNHELQDLMQYLTATLVMVKCKQSAIRVSKEVWTKIEERILAIN